MSLQDLIQEAKLKDEDFAKRMNYWLIQRKKPVDLEWLMPHLERILGKIYVANAAREYLNGQESK